MTHLRNAPTPPKQQSLLFSPFLCFTPRSMGPALSLFSLLPPSPHRPQPALPPHTLLNDDGTLACEPGFALDTLVDDLGCFPCADCAQNEACTRDGCSVPKPTISGVSLTTLLLVNYSVSAPAFSPVSALCRVGDTLRPAFSVTPTRVACFLPDSPPETVFDIGSSFGADIWSDPIRFSVASSWSVLSAVGVGVGVVCVCAVGTAVLCVWRKIHISNTRPALLPVSMASDPSP